MTTIRRILSLFWPVTKAKLHRLVTWIGVAFAGLTVVLAWWGTLGLSTEGKIGATIGILTTLLAGWRKAAPKLDAGIDALPIPDDDDGYPFGPVDGPDVPRRSSAAPEQHADKTPVTKPEPMRTTGGRKAGG